MSTTETKIDAILDAIRQDIAERETVADHAMRTLEKINHLPRSTKMLISSLVPTLMLPATSKEYRK